MYDLHTHSLLSDGALLPSELIRRYQQKGYKAVAITDHVDKSNIKQLIQSILEFTHSWPKASKIKVIAGIELTHLPLEQFKPLVKYARDRGIKLIIAHGETLVEPVLAGTNQAAIEAGVDILAHPGMIKEEEARLAAKKGVYLEITARRGHCLSNGHLVKVAKTTAAKLILNSDSHTPEDILTPGQLKLVGLGAGLSQSQIDNIYKDIQGLVKF